MFLRTRVPYTDEGWVMIVALNKVMKSYYFHLDTILVLKWKEMIHLWCLEKTPYASSSTHTLGHSNTVSSLLSQKPTEIIDMTATTSSITEGTANSPNLQCCCGCENIPTNNDFVCFSSKRSVFAFTCLQKGNKTIIAVSDVIA